jgi:DNA-binding NtrC family response regulator
MKALIEYSWPGNVRELENVIERLVVTVAGARLEAEHLPAEIRVQDSALVPTEARAAADGGRRSLQADARAARVVLDHGLSAVHGSRDHARERARGRRRGLEEARGNYKIVARLFNMEPRDYKRFLNFLRKHDCQIPFKEYR